VNCSVPCRSWTNVFENVRSCLTCHPRQNISFLST